MAGGIDLNAVDEGDEEAPPEEEEEEEEEGGEEEEEEENNNTSNTVSPPPLPSSSPEVCEELWRACAGPLVTPPRKGSVVVYLPQGHLEQAGDVAHLLPNVPPSPPLSSLVFCRVVDVKLHADVGTDDVYAQLFLVAESEDVQKRLSEGVEDEGGDDEEEAASVGKSLQMMTHMFCKTLTASDTSTHGGLSVPRRAAEDCFPPLDYKQQRPSQELTAKDLHGTQWRFRHIYRGQPRRHLLTTGWSAFVNKKKLVLGDAVLFLRGTDGELRLGIRRAGRLKGGLSFSTSGIGMNAGTFADVSRAIESKAAFLVYYNPRGSSAEFIIPYRRFLKSCSHSFSLGTRVKMRFENEDATERYSGLITGFSDIDPIRWSGSKWRCLIAKWDGDYDACGINRVSPWDVEPTGCVSGSDCLPAANCKRAKLGPANNLEFSFPNAGQYPDFRKSGMLHGVLQGQEIVGFRSKHDGGDPPNPQPSELGHHQSYERCNSYVTGCLPAMPVDSNGLAMGKYEFSNKSTGFGESFRFNKVLQGQEIFPSMPFCAGRFSPHPRDDTIYANNWYPPLVGVGNPKQQPPISSTNLSSPSSVFMFPQVGSRPPCSPTLYQSKDCEQVEVHWASHSKLYSELEVPMHCHQALFHGIKCSSTLSERSHIGNRDAICAAHPDSTDAHCSLSTPRKSCRLFGFSLTETDPVTRSDVPESTTLLSRADNIFHSSKGRDSRYCSEAQLH